VFDSRIALSIHAGRIHKSDGRDKNYQCPYCTKSFFNSSYLSQHMRIHTGVKPYECSKCLKSFKQLSHLQQHERTHSGEHIPCQLKYLHNFVVVQYIPQFPQLKYQVAASFIKFYDKLKRCFLYI